MMYDVLASYYDALVEDAQARDAWIELIEANIRGRSILDAACGSGDIAIELARRGYAVTAFDCSEQMLAAAREKVDSDRGICGRCRTVPMMRSCVCVTASTTC